MNKMHFMNPLFVIKESIYLKPVSAYEYQRKIRRSNKKYQFLTASILGVDLHRPF